MARSLTRACGEVIGVIVPEVVFLRQGGNWSDKVFRRFLTQVAKRGRVTLTSFSNTGSKKGAGDFNLVF